MMKLERREGARAVACGLESGGLEDCWSLTSVCSQSSDWRTTEIRKEMQGSGVPPVWGSCLRLPCTAIHQADGLHLEPHPH